MLTAAAAESRVWAATSPYEVLQKKAETIRTENSTNGWAYIVSGAFSLGVSIPAYFLSDDVFAKSVYIVGETLGIAAVGYGSYLVLIENDYRRFNKVLKGVPELSEHERNKLSRLFLQENALQAKNIRKIKVITFALTAGLNYLDGFTTQHRELKTTHFFLAAINTLAALSFTLSKSEEEKMYESLASSDPVHQIDLVVGNYVGLRFHF